MEPINLQQFIQTGLLNLFAGLFQEEANAAVIFGFIGYPNYNRPQFPANGNTMGYWTAVGQQIEAGILPGGNRDLRPLVDAALNLYPATHYFSNIKHSPKRLFLNPIHLSLRPLYPIPPNPLHPFWCMSVSIWKI